ncbi:MAG: thymidine kinase [Firmicutes bacterium]|nr:thymidine kinase [Bacillota bacterium]
MTPASHRPGRLVVICGPMFAGKSTELLRRVKRARRARIEVLVLKPAVDTRTVASVRSHDGDELGAVTFASAEELRRHLARATPTGRRLIAIDEAQFASWPGFVEAVLALVADGDDVVVAGLDLDYAGAPFGPMPTLLCYADEVEKLSAVCVQCGRDANRTQRLVDGRPAGPGPQVLVGASETYEPRCAACWVSPEEVARSAASSPASGRPARPA